MNDKELTELAAKAFGVAAEGFSPLTDDGDALRLAVQLGLEIYFIGDDTDGGDSECSVGYPESVRRPCRIKYVFEPHRGDIFAATRRAIVRAAAEQAKDAEAR